MENKSESSLWCTYMPSSEQSMLKLIRINHLLNWKVLMPLCYPPSSPVLEQKIKRTHYVSLLWKGIDQQSPAITDLDPCQHGLECKCDNLTIRWFDGDQLPMDVCQAIDADTLRGLSETNASENWIELSSYDESDSETECELCQEAQRCEERGLT